MDDLRDRIEARETGAALLPLDLPPRVQPAPAAGAPDDYEHTGARFLATRPEDAAEVLRALAEGVSPVTIARRYHVGVGTVLAVRRRAAPELEAERRVVATRARDVALSAIEAADEALQDPVRRRKLSARDAAITAGILIQRSAELDAAEAGAMLPAGVGAAPGHDDYLRELAALGVGVGVGMGLATVRAGQRAPAGPAGRVFEAEGVDLGAAGKGGAQ